MMKSVVFLCIWTVVRTQVIPGKSRTNDGDYNTVNTDGSFDFGYANKDVGSSYHLAHGGANKVVGGKFGAKDPATGTIKETVYSAGPRGFRAKGPNVHRKMDLDQRPRGPIGNKDDPYFDPNESPAYDFKVNTRTYSKTESADGRGDVRGQYTYIDDVGERHDVSYIAGRDTGFHVSSPVPDSPSVIGSPFHRAPLVRGESKQRGRSAVQRGLDGSYRFISAGPDQRRTESSDAHGNVRGSYTFLDDKGVQRTVHYIAGPGIGYRIVKSSTDPFIPPYFPTIPSPYDPDFIAASVGSYAPDDTGPDDVFKGPHGTAASGHVKPSPFSGGDKDRSTKKPGFNSQSPSTAAGSNEVGYTPEPYGKTPGPYGKGSEEANDGDEGGTGFGNKATSAPGRRPSRPTNRRPTTKPFDKPADSTKRPYIPTRTRGKPTINSASNEVDQGEETSNKKGPEIGVGFEIQHSRPAATIIRNIGEDYFGVPPGVAVRAHVQSIDLYPYESKPISPSEAIENDKVL